MIKNKDAEKRVIQKDDKKKKDKDKKDQVSKIIQK
jgi:hypothetical protein